MASNTLRFLDKDTTCCCDILDKETGIFGYVAYMLDRTNQMFTYEGLPDTIPPYMLELMLQSYGEVGWTEVNGELYVFRCTPGGPPDPYYRETQFIVANPALMAENGTRRIVNHLPPFDRTAWESYLPGVLMRSDTQSRGLLPLFNRYATELVENDVSIRVAQINSRQQTLIAANDGPEKESADQYIKNLEAGKISTVATRPFLDGVKAATVTQQGSNAIIQLIELQQYLKASWFNELGLNSTFNMKREYLSSEEIKSTTDVLLPLIDDMLYCRQIAIDSVNDEFGTNITVEKNGAWANKQGESDMKTELDEPIEELAEPEGGEKNETE